MKYAVLDSFKADYKRLSSNERDLFKQVLPTFASACDRYAANPATPWPASLRVKGVENAPGIFEMTGSVSGPDCRATFEWVQIDGGPGLRWRRVGGHAIFKDP